jgi:hypothetical protein
MLQLRSTPKATVRGNSPAAKVEIGCWTEPSKTSKSDACSPVTSSPVASVTVAYTSTSCTLEENWASGSCADAAVSQAAETSRVTPENMRSLVAIPADASNPVPAARPAATRLIRRVAGACNICMVQLPRIGAGRRPPNATAQQTAHTSTPRPFRR